MNRTSGAQGDDLLRPVLDGAADYVGWMILVRFAAAVALIAAICLIAVI